MTKVVWTTDADGDPSLVGTLTVRGQGTDVVVETTGLNEDLVDYITALPDDFVFATDAGVADAPRPESSARRGPKAVEREAVRHLRRQGYGVAGGMDVPPSLRSPARELAAQSEPTGRAREIIDAVPFLRPAKRGETRLTRTDLRNWLMWVKAGRPSVEAFDPALHPRGPDGKFVERPYDIPDSVRSTVEDLDGGNVLAELVEEGELEDADLDSLLSDPGIRIDDVPDDIDTADELRRRIDQGDTPLVEDTGDDTGTDGPPLSLEEVDPDADYFERVRPLDEPETGDVVVIEDRRTGETKVGQVTDTNPGRTPDKVELADGTVVRSDARGEYNRAAGNKYEHKRFWRPEPGFQGPAGTTEYGIGEYPDRDDIRPDDPRFDASFTRRRANMNDVVRVARLTTDGQEVKVGEVTTVNGGDRAVTFPDGEVVNVTPTSDYPKITGGIPPESPLYNVDPTRDTGRFSDGIEDSEAGDFVRVRGPRDVWQMARVENRDGDHARVVLSDGQVVDAGAGEGYDIQAFEDALAGFDPDIFVTPEEADVFDPVEEDVGAVDARGEADAPERVGTAIPPEAVENQDIPEGAILARDRVDDRRYKVTGYAENATGDPVIQTISPSGRAREYSAGDFSRMDFYAVEPRSRVRPSLDGWEDADLEEREEIAREAVEATVPRLDDNPTNPRYKDFPISDDDFETVKDDIAREMAQAKDPEFAQQVIGSLMGLGDDIGRAHASPDVDATQPNRGWFNMDNAFLRKTRAHELGHAVGYAFGLVGGDNDMDNQTTPMPSHKWQSPKFDAPEKYGMPAPPELRDRDQNGNLVDADESFFQLEPWTEEVEDQAGKGLDGRNFTSPPEGLGETPGTFSDPETLDPGEMFLAERKRDGDQEAFEVVEAIEPGDWPDDVMREVFSSGVKTEGQIYRIRRKSGEEGLAQIYDFAGDKRVRFRAGDGMLGKTTVKGTRSSVPDDWGVDTPDADDYLGTESYDDPETAALNLGDRVNRAWYRQAAATREHGESYASRLSIGGGYSAKQAHETMSRVHEVLRDGNDGDDWRSTDYNGMGALVKHHPDLLETYRAIYDIPPEKKAALNLYLEKEGHDFRFEDAPDPSDDVRERIEGHYDDGGSDRATSDNYDRPDDVDRHDDVDTLMETLREYREEVTED